MRLLEWNHLINREDFTATPEFKQVEADIRDGISAIHWPPESNRFTLNPTKKGNGVVPIKDAFVELLSDRGWEHEVKPRLFDAEYDFKNGTPRFGAEWETGNISSSHRAINRILLSALQNDFVGGILIVPDRETYPFLTDRVGNEKELRRYFPLWQKYGEMGTCKYFGVVVFAHDDLDPSVPLIKKGTDGRALV